MADVVQEQTGAEDVVWDLSALYTGIDDPAIERDIAENAARAEQFAAKYRGRVAQLSTSELAEALAELEIIIEQLERYDNFASLLWTTDTNNQTYGALMQRGRELESARRQTLLFFDLEWANIPEEKISIVDDPALARWRHYLLTELASRPYLLSEPEEKILAEKSVTGIQAWTRYFSEVFGAARYNLDGQPQPLDVVSRKLYTPDRDMRKKAADALTEGLRNTLKTSTYIFNTMLADKASNDKLRSYPTWISSRNLRNEVSDETVDALVDAVTSRYDLVSRYYKLKKNLLGYDDLFDYDRYASLAKADSSFRWEQAKDIVLTAFGAFSEDMGAIAEEFFDNRWIHAPALPGKRSGAFATPTIPSAHPYVFVNFTGINRDITTLAHELGHGIHMYLSRPKGVLEAGTPLTTAEMASVFAEMLVFNDLMSREQDRNVKISMLASKIEDTFATVFRQVSMNRFENAIHTARRTEGELSSERITELWLGTQRAMFGDSVTLRDDYGLWWSYIPHFINTPGYVYAYAFGELLVLALFNKYKQEGPTFVPKYLEVLSMGGADRPENILSIAGVDLTDPNFWSQGLNTIESMVSELEALVNG
jgi:oligoendopeptidase F